MLGPTSTVSYPHQKREKIYINVFPQLLTTYRPTMCWSLPLEFYLSGHLKILVYSAQIEHEETNMFFKTVEPFETSQDLWKGVTIHHRKCLCMRWFKGRTFWAFVLNCELITSKNSGVIELEMCIVCVLCQL